MSDTDKIIELRKIFALLPPHVQYSEWKRMERIIFNKKAIKLSSPREPGRERVFNSVPEVLKYIRNNGYPNAHSSNIHKALNGDRKKAYGFVVRYED